MPKTKQAADAADDQFAREVAEKAAAKAKRDQARAAKPQPAPKKGNKTTNVAVVKDDKKAEQAKVVASLDRTANEINVRFEKAAKLEGDANDHRLAAAILLEEARAKLEGTGVKFKDWAEKHVKQAWETVRKLVVIGGAKNPAKALADMRSKNAEANKKHREAKKAGTAPRAAIAAPAPVDVVRALKPEAQAEVVKTVAQDLGVVILTADEHAALKQKAKAPEIAQPEGDYNAVVAGFNNLRPSEKLRFVRFAAEVCGVTLAAVAKQPDDGDDMPEIPPAFDRRPRRE